MKDFQPLSKVRRQVILDTDIGPDCDDAGAVAVLIYYAQKYGFPIIGVANCTSAAAGNGTLKALFDFCKMPLPPMAKWSGQGFFDGVEYQRYNVSLAERFAPDYMKECASSIEDSTTFYRRLLADAEDKSIMLITIGMFNNIAALCDSPADDISPLDGKRLLEKKVYAIVAMGTTYPSGREFNIFSATDAARRVLCDVNVPVYLSDFHVGASVQTDIKDMETEYASRGLDADDNPIFYAYQRFTAWSGPRGNCVRPTWDLTTVQFAVLGEGDMYSTVPECGKIEFYAEEGQADADATRFVPCESGNIRYIAKVADDSVIKADLERIMKSFR